MLVTLLGVTDTCLTINRYLVHRTDLALKSMEHVKDRVSTCILATCCHGVCNWDDYVGREYLCAVMDSDATGQAISFGSAEFNTLRRWSEGTVHVSKVDEDTTGRAALDDFDHPVKRRKEDTADARTTTISDIVDSLNLQCGPQGLGRACQRLIDYGRLCYVRKILFSDGSNPGELLYYVPDSVTPQNAALVASKVRGN